MTCIVGLVEGKDIYMGGDSACSDDDWSLNLCYDKVFVRPNFIYGYAGNARFCQLVEFAFEPPPITKPLDAYMCTDWVDALRECQHEGGHMKKRDNREEIEGSLLVGVRGRLFHVYSGFDCIEFRDRYGAIGCANHIALGSMYATKDLVPKDRIKMALKAAEKYSAGVRRPFQIKVLKGTD